jgi:hypothetical protein
MTLLTVVWFVCLLLFVVVFLQISARRPLRDPLPGEEAVPDCRRRRPGDGGVT